MKKVCGGAAALSLLLGEEGYTVIVKLLTAKVMQGLRSIRVPVIIYRKKKTTLHCENQMAWQINAPSFGERILKAKVVYEGHAEAGWCRTAVPQDPTLPAVAVRKGVLGVDRRNPALLGHPLVFQDLQT